jgi:hypothetical protein
MLYLRLASVLYTWRKYPSKLNPRFLARSITDYAVPGAGFGTLYTWRTYPSVGAQDYDYAMSILHNDYRVN